MELFDQHLREDASPARHGEDSFSFLNRAAGERWEHTRSLVESWFAEFPDEDQADLRGRYRSKLPGAHLGAWWELYVHRLLKGLGYHVEVHPEVPTTDKRPDFRATSESGAVYVEAATVFSGIVDSERDGTREGWILAALDRGSSDEFFISIEFERVGHERPADAEIFKPVEQWLAGLDPDAVEQEFESSGSHPRQLLEVRDWRMNLDAIPIGAESRGPDPNRRLVGLGPPIAGFIDDKSQIRDTARRKGSKYGSLDAALVLAVNCATSFPKADDFAGALFGSIAYQFEVGKGSGESVRLRDGVWMDDRGPARRQLSGVLAATQVHPHTVLSSLPMVWANPWAAKPLTGDWPFSLGTADAAGFLQVTERVPNMKKLLRIEASHHVRS